VGTKPRTNNSDEVIVWLNIVKIKTAYNSTYNKLAVQWLNEVLCLVSSSVLADSLALRNRQLLVAAKRYQQP